MSPRYNLAMNFHNIPDRPLVQFNLSAIRKGPNDERREQRVTLAV